MTPAGAPLDERQLNVLRVLRNGSYSWEGLRSALPVTSGDMNVLTYRGLIVRLDGRWSLTDEGRQALRHPADDEFPADITRRRRARSR